MAGYSQNSFSEASVGVLCMLYMPEAGAGLQIFFQDWWAVVTHGAKNGGSFSEMMGPSISN